MKICHNYAPMELKWLLFVWAASIFHSSAIALSVDTKYGTVLGKTIELHTGKSVTSFHAIPYAKPPVGDLRWMPPEEPLPWSEPLEAFTLGRSCPQDRLNHRITHPTWDLYGEECLHLNIVTPQTEEGGGDALLPVLVYLHGGAYQTSSNIQFPGHFLAALDVVVVVPNYRLGILGFGTTNDETMPGNYGLLDQLLALQFVQENIESFGGDPGRVTIFGESAGACSVGLMMMSPLAEGLFHQAIMQSGSEIHHWGYSSPNDTTNYMDQVAADLGCADGGMEERLDCLRQIADPEEVMNVTRTCTPGYLCYWEPRVDAHFLPATPGELRAAGEYHHVAEMIGVTAQEYYLGVSQVGYTRAQFEAAIREDVGEKAPAWPDSDRAEDVTQAALFAYTPWPWLEDRRLNRQALGEYRTDKAFGFRSDEQAKLHAADGNPTYYYVFSHVANSSLVTDWMGAVHGSDIFYVFGYPLLQYNEAVRNNSGLIFAPIDFDEDDVEISNFIMKLWTNFAKSGTPTPEPVPNPKPGPDITWEDLSPDNLNYLWIGPHGDHVGMKKSYKQKEYAFWREYASYIVNGYQ